MRTTAVVQATALISVLLSDCLVESAFIRGVNLNVFVPERWMVPSFYAGTNATSLCDLSRQHPALAAERMHKRLESVGSADFAWLAEQGFNAVRVPLGWWNVVSDVGWWWLHYPVGPHESLAVIDRLFEWADAHGLAILLDLHGAPGSQNGADHSGCDLYGIGSGSDLTPPPNPSPDPNPSLSPNPYPNFHLHGIGSGSDPNTNTNTNPNPNPNPNPSLSPNANPSLHLYGIGSGSDPSPLILTLNLALALTLTLA